MQKFGYIVSHMRNFGYIKQQSEIRIYKPHSKVRIYKPHSEGRSQSRIAAVLKTSECCSMFLWRRTTFVTGKKGEKLLCHCFKWLRENQITHSTENKNASTCSLSNKFSEQRSTFHLTAGGRQNMLTRNHAYSWPPLQESPIDANPHLGLPKGGPIGQARRQTFSHPCTSRSRRVGTALRRLPFRRVFPLRRTRR